MSLNDYQNKRKLAQSNEPASDALTPLNRLRYVVHWHSATRLHFDLRLEWGGALHSWAVPKGPSLSASERMLAVHVENHPIDYAYFEGCIPKGNYGAGPILLWDAGFLSSTADAEKQDSEESLRYGYDKGHIRFFLVGHKLRGEFHLVRGSHGSKEWLLLKQRDAYAVENYRPEDQPRSVATGRLMTDVLAAGTSPREESLYTHIFDDVPYLAAKSSGGISRPALREPELDDSPLVTVPQMLAAAPKERMPVALKAMMPVKRADPFQDVDWVVVDDPGGTRVLAYVSKARVKIISKHGRDISSMHPALVEALRPASQAFVVDGTICGESDRVQFVVSDILHQDGKNLRDLAYEKRRSILADLGLDAFSLGSVSILVEELRSLSKDGQKEQSARHRRSKYSPGISNAWLHFSRRTSRETFRITSPTKLLWPDEKITKKDLIDYYHSAADLILPWLKDRPLSLLRYTSGVSGDGFYQKNVTGYLPGFLSIAEMTSGSGKTISYLMCQNEDSLLYLINFGCIDLHPWLALQATPDRPEQVLMDLDPDEQSFGEVVEVALEVRNVLQEMGHRGYVKTSGSTGMHIFVHVGGTVSFDEARSFAQVVGHQVERRLPQLVTLERSPGKRRGKLYFDTLQNRRGQTIACALSVRPRSGAPVSMPLSWDELEAGVDPTKYRLDNAHERFSLVKNLWINSKTPIENISKWLVKDEK